MNDESPAVAFADGPFVAAACFCETALQEKTGVFSLIRIIDVVTQTASGPEPPEDMPALSYETNLVLMLKSGRAKGRSEINIKIEDPSGITESGPTISAHFEGDNKGYNLITKINFNFAMEGVYWFKIYLEGQLLTKLPFQIKYSRIITNSG